MMLTGQLFQTVRQQDSNYIATQPYIEKWGIQSSDSPLLPYAGPSGILEWFLFDQSKTFVHYLPQHLIDPLIDLSRRHNQHVCRLLGEHQYIYPQVDVLNAVDYTFQNLYPVP